MISSSSTTLGAPVAAPAFGRRRLLSRFRKDCDIPGSCVYNTCLQAPLQQQTLVSPLTFQNICAPQSFVPPVRCKMYFTEGGFITKPVSRTYVLRPTLVTRIKGFLRRSLFLGKNACVTYGGTLQPNPCGPVC